MPRFHGYSGMSTNFVSPSPVRHILRQAAIPPFLAATLFVLGQPANSLIIGGSCQAFITITIAITLTAISMKGMQHVLLVWSLIIFGRRSGYQFCVRAEPLGRTIRFFSATSAPSSTPEFEAVSTSCDQENTRLIEDWSALPEWKIHVMYTGVA